MKEDSTKTVTFHYGWIVMAMGLLTTIGTHGFARMAYTLILPPMKDGPQLNYAQLGLLGTGNFIGYLTLAIIGGFLAARFGTRVVISLSLILMGITMILTENLHKSFGPPNKPVKAVNGVSFSAPNGPLLFRTSVPLGGVVARTSLTDRGPALRSRESHATRDSISVRKPAMPRAWSPAWKAPGRGAGARTPSVTRRV